MRVDKDEVYTDPQGRFATYTRPTNVMVVLNDGSTYANLIGTEVVHLTNEGYSQCNDKGEPGCHSSHILGRWLLLWDDTKKIPYIHRIE